MPNLIYDANNSKSNNSVFSTVLKYCMTEDGIISLYNNRVIVLNLIERIQSSLSYIIEFESPIDGITVDKYKYLIYDIIPLLALKKQKDDDNEKCNIMFDKSKNCLSNGMTNLYSFPDYYTKKTVIKAETILDMVNSLNPIIIIDNLKENQQFETLLNFKATDGAGRISLQDKFGKHYDIIMPPNLLKLNKSDKISLYVYPYNNELFYTKFRIIKNKIVINIILKFLYLR